MSIKKASSSSILNGIKLNSTSNKISATGGDEIKIIGNFKYHVFTTLGSNNFKVNSGSGKIDVLAIGGGGGGGFRIGGGGGAGALTLFTAVDVSIGSYNCFVGHGGSGSSSGQKNNGGSSFFSRNNSKLVQAQGGGGGGAQTAGDGNMGGSGGGADEWSNVGAGAIGGYDYGPLCNIGGNSRKSPYSGGGGGGALSAGISATDSNGGAGGSGYTLSAIDSNLTSANFTSFSGMTVVCSGGGGGSYQTGNGGAGGTGAGNGGRDNASGTNATSFGSGGGGGGGDSGGTAAGSGKQGVVVIRYPIGNTSSSSFISNGLVLHLDAANTSSYNGSGFLWSDLSGNGNHVTMQNSGSITYNAPGFFRTGADGYFSRTGSTTIGTGDSDYTFIVWARKPSTWGNTGLITISDSFATNQTTAFRTHAVGGERNQGNVGSFRNYWWSNDVGYTGQNAADMELNKWFMATATYDGSTRRIYGNNICLVQDTPIAGRNIPNTNILIGKTFGTEYLNGDIAVVLVYDRGLTSSEITEVFNSYRSRFGI